MHLLFVLFDALMAVYFVFAAVVNFNDPDPVRWVSMYFALAAACVLALLGRLPWAGPGALALIALLWAGTLAPRVIGKVRFRAMFSTWKMQNAQVEEAREMYGLLIAVIWMLVLVGQARGI
jgi:Transmembrane family 220, helix